MILLLNYEIFQQQVSIELVHTQMRFTACAAVIEPFVLVGRQTQKGTEIMRLEVYRTPGWKEAS